MYSIQHHSNYSYYETRNCIRKQQRLKFNNDKSKDILPVYQTPCTFQKTGKDDANTMFYRSSLVSFCVPDVYSPGSNGKCSPPPPSSNLPPPPSEWLP